jgi:hypothetical protein
MKQIPHNPISLFKKANHFNKAKVPQREEKPKTKAASFHVFVEFETFYKHIGCSNYVHNCKVTNFPN